MSWYKDGHVISHGIKNHSNALGLPEVQHNRDEGLYKCVVSYKKQIISKLITVIVKKGWFFRICVKNTHEMSHILVCRSLKVWHKFSSLSSVIRVNLLHS